MDSTSERDENGRLKLGCASINPEGKNGHRKGWTPYGIRSVYLLGKYSPDEIKAILSEPERRKDVSTYDFIILTHIIGSFAGDDRRLEREQLIDRIEGKSVDKKSIEVNGDIGIYTLTDDERAERTAAILERGRQNRARQIDSSSSEVGATSRAADPSAI